MLPLEIFKFPTIEQPKPEEKEAEEPADISDVLWHQQETLLQEETEVSIKLALPKGQEHITRLQVNLFAKTQSGPDPISKVEGSVQDYETAIGKVPVNMPNCHYEGSVEIFFRFIHLMATMMNTKMLPRAVSEIALISAGHILISGASTTKQNKLFLTNL